MAVSHADIREKLAGQTLYQLQALAKALDVRGCSDLNKAQLEERLISQAGDDRLRKTLFQNWWDRNHNHVYGAGGLLLALVGIALAIVFGLPAFVPSDRLGSNLAEAVATGRNPPVAPQDSEDRAVASLDPPPFDFPSPETAGVKPLTDEQRLNESFVDARVMIRNDTSKKLRVAFGYRPYRERNAQIGASSYVHRESQEVPAGVTMEQRESNFGGPVHVSIFADGKWTATNEWVDLGVVARRTLVVKEKDGVFFCRVDFEEKP